MKRKAKPKRKPCAKCMERDRKFLAARDVLQNELANGTTEVNGRHWLTAEALERVIRAMEGCDAYVGDWKEAQRRSFAYGNVNISNPDVTREIVEEEANKMSKQLYKPKFHVGQVVAIWGSKKTPPYYYRIAGFYWDREDKLRYTFDCRNGDNLARSLQPEEGLLRALTAAECGQSTPRKRRKP